MYSNTGATVETGLDSLGERKAHLLWHASSLCRYPVHTLHHRTAQVAPESNLEFLDQEWLGGIGMLPLRNLSSDEKSGAAAEA